MPTDDEVARLMARLTRPTATTPTRIAVIADPHVGTDSEGTIKQFEHTRENFEAALDDALARGVDAVVSPGDLTKDGEPWNYDAVVEALDDIDVPFYAVPGNHDVPKERDEHDTPPVSRFVERFTPGDLPFHVTVGGVDLVGFNTAGSASLLYDAHDGAITDAERDRLDELLAGVDDPIAVTHFNLPPIPDQLREYRDAGMPEMAIPPELRDPERVTEPLTRHDVPLLLTGHYHLPSTGQVGPTTEVMAPATCSFPQAYLLVTVDERGTSIEFIPIADRARLTDGHLALQTDTPTGQGLVGVAAVRLAELPLVDEWEAPA